MNFMQKGLERKREGAKEEVRQLLEELEANGDENDDETNFSDDELTPQPSKIRQLLEELEANGDENDDETNFSDDELTPQPSKKKGEKKQAVADDSHVAKGKLLAKGLEFGNRSSVTVAGLISVDLQLGTKIEPADNKLEVTDTETAETTESNTKTTHPLSNKIKTTRKKKNLW
eukprot:CAMPEP_0194393136 /NCGR_PEP_ID=MMETSP0174-20130528/123130_1 /TAXON_ID=216777 /ORGANISM="Proboscia alata, Strain PI-D3" /LENGTH=173 /DNA_ID=CAMNT_0039188787 /DNA_START=1012 /DNA_END=1530 /DNA_ORIENTATION=+